MSGKAEIRKYYDVGPTSVAASDVYTGGLTGWAAGVSSTANGSSGSTQYWISGIQQSDDDQGRVGQSINVETLDVRVQVIPDNALAGHGHLRMIIFADEEFDGALPADIEILGNRSTTAATGFVMSFLQPGYFGRFRIIEDKHWSWWNSSTLNSFQENETPASFWHDSHHDMKGARCMWDASNNSTIASARKGQIFIYFYYQLVTVAAGGIPTVVTTNPPAIQYTTRIRFRDT